MKKKLCFVCGEEKEEMSSEYVCSQCRQELDEDRVSSEYKTVAIPAGFVEALEFDFLPKGSKWYNISDRKWIGIKTSEEGIPNMYHLAIKPLEK
jgi:hypothetical protein